MNLAKLFRLYWFLWAIGQVVGNYYNQPKLCPTALWNASAITFATIDMVGLNPWAVLVTTRNTVYAANRESGVVRAWHEGSIVPTRNISGNLSAPYSLFASNDDDDEIYIDNGEVGLQVDKWSSTSASFEPVMYVCGGCYGLLIDIKNNLYCSMSTRHQVISKSLDSRLNVWNIVAGISVAGAMSVALNRPRGIAMDANLNLYVADCGNNRIQRFAFGQRIALTVVGTRLSATLSLNCPSAMAFDAIGNIFISDSLNHRILSSSTKGFRCIVGCSGMGSSPESLSNPLGLSFDTYGNLYVVDNGNSRIQKFLVINNVCGVTATTGVTTVKPSTTTSRLATPSTDVPYSNGISYNQPTFSALASWSGTAITLATSSTVGRAPYGLFVDTADTVYVADRANNRIQMWLAGSSTPTRTIAGGLFSPLSIFATNNGDIYVDNGFRYKHVDKWMLNGTRNRTVMYVKNECYGLFIDINNNLYCSMFNLHHVMMQPLDSNTTIWMVAAGTDCSGSTSNTLRQPWGIFVDTDLSLFVADCGNNRVQKFLSRQLNAITVAGNGASGTIALNCPSGILLDGNGYLFIADTNNHRIVASGPNGFRCIVGCSMVAGALSSQLNNPSDLKFDSYGNIFVTDRGNNRVQKFILLTNVTYPLSINQPNFCPSTTWYRDAIPFANSNTIGLEPYGLFVDRNNTIYAANRQRSVIQIWFEGNINPNVTLRGSFISPISLFVTFFGDIYIDNGMRNRRVDKWSISANNTVPVMAISGECYSLFVDTTNTLYCSMTYYHRVVKKWLLDDGTTPVIAAGTGVNGSSAEMLYYPVGLFVNLNLSLYIADCGNDRIQMFLLGQMSAITVAGDGAPGTITLNCPNAITFDANGYLFISDNDNDRIIGSGPRGFRCLVGCTGLDGNGPRQLNSPRQFSFDTYGNLYIADQFNHRIQKFMLASNSCSLSYNRPKFCSNTLWSAIASTLASSATIGVSPYAIFIDGINNIYAPSRASNAILMWSQWGAQIGTIVANFDQSFSVFVSINGDVYFDDGLANRRVSRFLFNTTTTITAMNVNGSCYGLFIDLNNYLYCSLKDFHQVVKVLLNSGITIPTIAAGTGSPGSASNMLNAQQGIYVDHHLNLYIADCGNNRIQFYQSGQISGVTLAGEGASGTISLSCPTGVVLDFDNYLFIVDSHNHRIVGSSLDGYRCLVGCSEGGATSSQLSFPQSMAFDSYGNMYVTDRNNSRIQIFSLKTNCSTHSTIATSTVVPTTMLASTTAAQTTALPTTTSLQTTSTISADTAISSTAHLAHSTVPISTTAGDTTLLSTERAIQTTTRVPSINADTTAASTVRPIKTTAPMSTTAADTTATSTVRPIKTTDPMSTTAADTTTSSTVNPIKTTDPMSTTAAGTTASSTVNSIKTTAPMSTSAADTTASSTVNPMKTTAPMSTSAADATTSSMVNPMKTTDPMSTTAAGTTASSTVNMIQSTTQVPTNDVKVTTFPTTSSTESTDSIQTTFMPVTTSNIDTKTVLSIIQRTTNSNLNQWTSSKQHSTTVTSTVPVCYSPVITLIPGPSNLTDPLEYRRSQDISINSMIQLNCDISLSTIIRWTIKNCTSTSCPFVVTLSPNIITTLSELYIPTRSLNYGTYELTLTVTMSDAPTKTNSSSIYIRIIATGIIANFLQMKSSMISRGTKQDLFFDPGTYSIDLDEESFDASKWKYEYYCRWYDLYDFPSINGVLLPIDDVRIDPNNPSCLFNQSANVIYGNSTISPKSSVTIRGGSLQPNQTYQFMVLIENLRNPAIQGKGYLIVHVQLNDVPLIVIGCVISVMCAPDLEYQRVNPTTQVSLFAICIGNCINVQRIQWNVYQGTNNESSNITQWTLFNAMNTYENNWFFGTQTSNFTATNQLFLNNPQINLWRFEIVYTLSSGTSGSTINFIINQLPKDGYCLIDPSNGTTTTLFTVSCPNWFDEDGIKDYSIYAWTNERPEHVMIAFSTVSTFSVRFPAGDTTDSFLHIVIHIQDVLHCVREVNMSSLIISVDIEGINHLMSSFQHSSTDLNQNPIVQLLFSENQNVVGQVIGSLSQEFNQMNDQNVDTALSNGIPATGIFIASLGSSTSSQSSIPLNESALIEYTRDLNIQANLRDYLMTFVNDLPITTMNSIILQSASLVQLTEATNQLTRAAATIAAERCYQLSRVLSSLAKTNSFEDVQIASRQLTQCASNVLMAINGPLQGRMLVLQLDLSRANEDNLFEQKQAADIIGKHVKEIDLLITSSLNIHLNLGQYYLINTSQTFLTLEVMTIDSLKNKAIEQLGNARLEISSDLILDIPENTTIILRSSMDPLASSGNNEVSSNTNLSRSISLSMLDQNGKEIAFQTEAIRLIIPRDPNLVLPSMDLQNVTSINSTNHQSIFNLHYINITTILPVSVHIEMHPLDETLAYLFIYKFDATPLLNTSISSIDGWTVFCSSHLNNESIYQYFLDNQQTVNHQSLIFGLRELNINETIRYCSENASQTHPPIIDEPFNFTSDYELRIYTSGCYYLDEDQNYKSDGLTVGPLTNHYQTECFSTHLTTFAGGFIVLPPPINWSYVFANLDFMRNKTVYFTVIIFSSLYLLLMIYARRKDKQDLEKLGVTPLPDNRRDDEYFYQILVFTGHRMDAGTKSKVHLILSGDQNETSVRRLEDPHRKIFQRGGIDAFVLAVPKSLGLLNYIQIWHDNSGEGSSASWFLKYIIIRDLQTMDKFYFIAQRWFAVEKDDGLIERILPVANEIEQHEFSYLLAKKTYHSVSDGHLWFSIFSRPPSNRFTRVQRCTCCFVLLFSSMLLNIMYYGLSIEAKSSNQTQANSLSIGPLYISAQQIGIGVMIEVFSLVPSLLIVQFFRRIRSREQLSPLRQALNKISPSRTIFIAKSTTKKRSSSLSFPWWCLFPAYTLSLMIMVVSIFFIIVRGIEFGDLKTQQWLTSILTGLFSSVIFTQPIKIIALAMFFAFFCRNSTDTTEENEYIDDEQIEMNDDHHQTIRSTMKNSPKSINRLSEKELAYARHQRLKEIEMWSIFREFALYAIFLTLICLITFSNRDEQSFYQAKHLRRYLLNTRQTDRDYTQVKTIREYWEWLEKHFVDNLHVQSNRLIGWPTMRQLRVKSQSCSDQRLISQCIDDYNLFNEEKQSFGPGWTNETTHSQYSSSILQSFRYQLSDALDSYIYIGEHGIYSGNGYVYGYRGSVTDLKNNLSELHRLEWIDEKTRAIIIQMTLYNPNVQLFTSVTLLAEFISTGEVIPSARMEPLPFYVLSSSLQLICTIIYMFMIIYLFVQQIRLFIRMKWKYFREFWSWIELGIIACSWGSLAVYIWRFRESHRISKVFSKTAGSAYINFQQAVYFNDLLIYLQGFCCFFGTIKLTRLCRINTRLTLLIETLCNATKELVSFLAMFSIVFMSFISLFYLLFVTKMHSCANLLSTTQMLFEVTLMTFDGAELLNADAILGPVCFTIFIIIVVFVCLSMFLSIINQNFHRMREQRNTRGDEDDLSIFIWNRFRRWIGMKNNVPSSQNNRSIEILPYKIDQLFQGLARITNHPSSEFLQSE